MLSLARGVDSIQLAFSILYLRNKYNICKRPDHNFRPKKYHVLFSLPFDAEAFKPCKNTIKLINLCAVPCLGLGLWLTLAVFFDLA